MSSKKSSKGEKLKNEKKLEEPSSLGKYFIVFLVLGGLTAYSAYKYLSTPLEKPVLDLEQWWGPYPIDLKKDVSIRPYQIEFSDVIVNDLRERLLHSRPLTPPLEDVGFNYGFNTNYLTKVLDYWKNNYNFKEREQFLNKYKHFITNIQGLDIHYMHVKPKVSANVTVVPILLIHGWPGSIREFYEIIPKLTTVRPDQKFVFEVIAPSIPGFGFSQAAVRPNMGPTEVAVVFRNLMKRIGHERYYVQGGDYGHTIGSILATYFPENVLGFHTNIPMVAYTPLVTIYALVGSLWPSLVVEPELQDRMYPLGKHFSYTLEESGYFHLQATKPDTVGVALSDSPAGLAAYILEKFSTWTNPEYKNAKDGGLLNKYSLTHLLDNVMIYWSTNSITTSMRHYVLGYKQMMLTDQIPTEVPTWGIKFKHELSFFPDCILKLKYKNYLQSTVVEDGGHFAAMEMPDVLANDIFKAVETFRDFNSKGKRVFKAETFEVPETLEPDYETAETVYEFTVKDPKGQDIKLEKYKGKVLIIVNVASQCGYTDNHYKQLNELYDKYYEKGLRILAFPCNQFGGQEPGTLNEILQFTKKKNVKFDIFEKIDVNGDDAHPLWNFLKKTQSGTLGDFVKWNFSKFIVDRNGMPVERFGPNVSPLELEPYLAKYL